ncbi:MAG TPA: type II toxin-antitoxin system RelE/ParE family toxin [Blastocatellia bacterium]
MLSRGDQLATFPLSGRMVPHRRRKNVRELIERPYRIVYRVRRDRVEVIDVFHSARGPASK